MRLLVMDVAPAPISGLALALRRQTDWWNRMRYSTRSGNRAAQLRFDFFWVSEDPAEDPPGLPAAVHDPERGERLVRWVRAKPGYRRGMSLLLAGAHGLDGRGQWSTTKNGGDIIHNVLSDAAPDGRGHPYSARMIHELGHVLGLRDHYGDGRHRPRDSAYRTVRDHFGHSYRSSSDRGFERNVMGDVLSDLGMPEHAGVPHPGGPLWLGQEQAAAMLRAVDTALIHGHRETEFRAGAKYYIELVAGRIRR